MEHKAEIEIEFLGRTHSSFAFPDAVKEALRSHCMEEDRDFEVYNMKSYRYSVTFDLFNRKSVQALNYDIQVLASHLQDNCDITNFKANVWTSNDNIDLSQIQVTEAKKPRFNHAMNMSFTVLSDTEDSPSPEEIRTGLQRAFKLCEHDDDELVDRCEIHDTFEIE